MASFFENKPDIDLNNAGQYSHEIPLHLAILESNTDAALILLENGADINVKNNEEQTALISLIEADVENLSMIEFLIKHDADLTSALRLAVDGRKFDTIRLLMSRETEVWKDQEHSDVKAILEAEADADIVEFFLKSPKMILESLDRSLEEYHYKLIKTLMERESWDCAMKLVLILDYAIYNWNRMEHDYETQQNQFGDDLGNNVIKPGFFEIIVSNMKNFNLVDEKGTKLLDMMLVRYLQVPILLDAKAGKEILTRGAEKSLLQEKLSEFVEGGPGARISWTPFEDSPKAYFKVIKQLIEIGADYPVDKLYVRCAEFGDKELLEEMIKKGANLFSHFEFTENEDRTALELAVRNEHDECVEIITREIQARGNKEQKKTLVNYLKENEKQNILSKIGFCKFLIIQNICFIMSNL